VEALLNRDFGPLIVETDIGNDVILALLYRMEHPGVELQAVTVVGTGLAHCEAGVRNALGLLELSQSPQIPLTCGSETPFGAEHAFPQAWRVATDWLWGFGLPTGGRQPDPGAARELIADYLRRAEAAVTILALGPLANFAAVLQKETALVDKVGVLHFISNAVKVPGNVYDESLGFDNRPAEWVIHADPLAAHMVFESGVPITLVPLNATN
jgi:pyrimidine-specific ribonucleoside hydrolase